MNKKKKIIIIIALIFLLLLCGVIIGMNWNKWFDDEGGESSDGTSSALETRSIDSDAGDYVPPVTDNSNNGGIAIPGWASISIPAGETEVTVDFPNPEANDKKYYLTFELRLKDTGEVLYTSGLVPPGKHIQHITLSRPLTEGTYKAVIHVQPYKMDEAQTPTNNANMETELMVYNK